MPHNMGALYWQINDCWPVASWSSIDYFGRWKALQYYAKRFYSDLLISPTVEDGSLKLYVRVGPGQLRSGEDQSHDDELRRQGVEDSFKTCRWRRW